MMILRSFAWNLEQSGKVINREVVSHSGILHVMSNGLKVDWVERIISYLRKVTMSFCCHSEICPT